MAGPDVTRVVLTVPEMSCGHCVQTVTSSLTPLSGVTDIAVDLPSKTIQVTYDPTRVTVETMRDVLADEDYPVTTVSAG